MSATFALSAAAPVGRAAAASTSLRQRLLKSSPRQPGSARRTTRGGTVYARVSGTERTSTTSQISSQIKDIRSQMEEDEDLNTLMAGLRGTNIDDSDFAADGVKMRVVDLDKIKAEGGDDDRLPLYYDPELIAQYWRRRPGAVAQRILQLSTIAGSFITGIIADLVTNKTSENSVKRAIQLREIVTSLGPAYIKLGQALSIRPDILSPQAMTELQKLCDKVPSFDNKIAFDTLERELGCKWQDIYSELGPDPVAAAAVSDPAARWSAPSGRSTRGGLAPTLTRASSSLGTWSTPTTESPRP